MMTVNPPPRGTMNPPMMSTNPPLVTMNPPSGHPLGRPSGGAGPHAGGADRAGAATGVRARVAAERAQDRDGHGARPPPGARGGVRELAAPAGGGAGAHRAAGARAAGSHRTQGRPPLDSL
eukprot:3735691-Pyramimonas_sp.AAC.1